jgi:ADP-ribosyl-[dinitrogen reductase] hydrolase
MSTRSSRIRGAMVGMAAGDALGAPYEFGPPLPETTPVPMRKGRGWELGEWTDDTGMAVAVAEAAVRGDLRAESTQDFLVGRWVEWSKATKDIGIQTSAILRNSRSAAEAIRASTRYHERTKRSGGNGSLMRTAPVALAFLGNPSGLTEAAAAISALTHFDYEAAEACVIWSQAIRHAVLTGELDATVGLDYIAGDRARVWAERLEIAERSVPRDFQRNGWVVEALQAAWCAITTTHVQGDSPKDHVRKALEACVRGGHDTDTVGAIAGALLGAAYGDRAIPLTWRNRLHGWPGLRVRGLGRLAEQVVKR